MSPTFIIGILLLVQTSLQAEDCGGLGVIFGASVVSSTDHETGRYPASFVLTVEGQWLARGWKTTGQFVVIKLDTCPRWISGCQIMNTNGRASREFRVSGSQSVNGPWQTMLEDELPNPGGNIPPILNYTFDQAIEVQFLKFDMVSIWGGEGGGLRYFAAIPVTIDCNVTTWTEWTACCNGERQRTRNAIRGDHCKAVSEGEECPEDNCPVDGANIATAGEDVSSEECNILFNVVIGLAALSGILLLLLIGVVYLIYKMWSTARNAIKKDVNP